MTKVFDVDCILSKQVRVTVTDDMMMRGEDPKEVAEELAGWVFHGEMAHGKVVSEEWECDSVREVQ